jgi:hypothetical protein
MPRGPKGEKRPADAIGAAVMVAHIATGEIEDERDPVKSVAASLGVGAGRLARWQKPDLPKGTVIPKTVVTGVLPLVSRRHGSAVVAGEYRR